MKAFVCWMISLLLLAPLQLSSGSPLDYASMRAEVSKAYAQQAEEMSQALLSLQQVSASTAAAISEIESACG